MATDGVGIIDGDLAHCTYNEIMDLFNSGLETKLIKEKFPLIIDSEKKLYLEDQFEEEVYFTVVGLAFWELGILSDQNIDTIEKIIGKQAGIKFFGEYDDTDGDKRRIVLENYLAKIKSKNTEPKSIITYPVIEETFFKTNDVILFKTESRNNRLLICQEVTQLRGKCSYSFIITNYLKKEKPNLNEIKERKFWISGLPKETVLAKSTSSSNRFGLLVLSMDNEMIIANKNKFETVGNLEIDPNKIVAVEVWGIEKLNKIEQSIIGLQNKISSGKHSLVSIADIL